MKTVLLAAGVGQRLGEVSGNRPKCLLEFGGKTLLKRHLEILKYYGITQVILVTGYRSNLLTAEIQVAGFADFVTTVHNPDYEKGSVLSMKTGLDVLTDDADFLLMDADVLYDHNIIGRLIYTRLRNCFLLDRNFIPGDEPVKLCVRNGQLIEFRKQVAANMQFDYQGESVGFFRFSGATRAQLLQSADEYLRRGEDRQPYEECIRDLLLASPDEFSFEDVTGLRWIEIDFPEDVGRAKTEILPAIARLN